MYGGPNSSSKQLFVSRGLLFSRRVAIRRGTGSLSINFPHLCLCHLSKAVSLPSVTTEIQCAASECRLGTCSPTVTMVNCCPGPAAFVAPTVLLAAAMTSGERAELTLMLRRSAVPHLPAGTDDLQKIQTCLVLVEAALTAGTLSLTRCTRRSGLA